MDWNFFNIGNEDHQLAYGWLAKRHYLLGSIPKSQRTSGIRVRAGNIQIGDSHILDQCYREQRFNSYITGEVHINDKYLIPNGRRDDFIDNENKLHFFREFERRIGIELSKDIRRASREHSDNRIKPGGRPKTTYNRNRNAAESFSLFEQDIQSLLREVDEHPSISHLLIQIVSKLRTYYYHTQ